MVCRKPNFKIVIFVFQKKYIDFRQTFIRLTTFSVPHFQCCSNSYPYEIFNFFYGIVPFADKNRDQFMKVFLNESALIKCLNSS